MNTEFLFKACAIHSALGPPGAALPRHLSPAEHSAPLLNLGAGASCAAPPSLWLDGFSFCLTVCVDPMSLVLTNYQHRADLTEPARPDDICATHKQVRRIATCPVGVQNRSVERKYTMLEEQAHSSQ